MEGETLLEQLGQGLKSNAEVLPKIPAINNLSFMSKPMDQGTRLGQYKEASSNCENKQVLANQLPKKKNSKKAPKQVDVLLQMQDRIQREAELQDLKQRGFLRVPILAEPQPDLTLSLTEKDQQYTKRLISRNKHCEREQKLRREDQQKYGKCRDRELESRLDAISSYF